MRSCEKWDCKLRLHKHIFSVHIKQLLGLLPYVKRYTLYAVSQCERLINCDVKTDNYNQNIITMKYCGEKVVRTKLH